MARTIGEIYNEMSSEKDALTQTSNLTPSGSTFSGLIADIRNNSRVAVWRLWLYIVAVGHWTQGKLMDRHKAEIRDMLENSYKGRTRWVVELSKEFIDGETLQTINGVPRYADSASGTQPVKYASVRKEGKVTYLYVAGEDSGGNRTPLASDVLDRFKTFVDRWQIPGTYYRVLSLNPDTLLANISIYYSGLLDEATVKQNVIDAINNHVENLPSKGALDGVLYLIDLTDALQNVEGVRDVVYNSISGNGSPISRKYTTDSGYMNFDEDNSTIQMNAV